ncbi:MAG: shikimate dehydrogenase [Cytophagales bacterium]|nr:MAG: shikimate dehydrogenase [Cytophagales bacterium]
MFLYGLIGYPLSHSFSKQYFTQKFQKAQLTNHQYELFPLSSIDELPNLLKTQPQLKGFNVTIPYKQSIIQYLDALSPQASIIGAVNTVKITSEAKLIGHNTDYEGFRRTLPTNLFSENLAALVLGTGGASKAVQAVLKDIKIPFQLVSRSPQPDAWQYESLEAKHFQSYELIVNTTPLGMYPAIETCPPIPYENLSAKNYCYDLVYNPTETLFLRKAKERGATIQNGLSMLYEQAEAAWQIWQNEN